MGRLGARRLTRWGVSGLAVVLVASLVPLTVGSVPSAGAGAAEPSEKACEVASVALSHTGPPTFPTAWTDSPTITVPKGASLRVYYTGTAQYANAYYREDSGSGWAESVEYVGLTDGSGETPSESLFTNGTGVGDTVRQVRVGWRPRSGANYIAHLLVTYGDDPNFTCGPVIDEVDPEEPRGECTHGSAGDPVNTLNGNFFDDWTDLEIPGRGYGLSWTRTYNSNRANRGGPLGPGWTHRFNVRIEVIDGGVAVHTETGAKVTFLDNGGGSFLSAPWVDATLSKSGSHYTLWRNGDREKLKFDASSGRFESHEDLAGNVTALTYTGSNLTRVTDASGRQLNLTYTGNLVNTITDPAGRVVDYDYQSGRLWKVTDVAGKVWEFGYDTAHRLTTVRAPRFAGRPAPQPVLENRYNSNGEVDWQKDQLGRMTVFEYGFSDDGAGLTSTRVTFPDGDQRVDEYTNNLCSAVTEGWGTAEAARTRFERNDPNTLGLTKLIDPLDHAMTYDYEDDNNPQRPTKITDALGRVTTIAYNDHAQPLSIANVDSKVVFEYTEDRVTKVRAPLREQDPSIWREVQFLREDSAHPDDVTAVIDERAKRWELDYDEFGYLDELIDPLGNKTTADLNNVGWLLSVVDPLGHASGGVPAQWTTSFGNYTAHGDARTVTNPEGEPMQLVFDEHRNLTSVTDAEGRTTGYGYDDADQLTIIDRPGSSDLRNEYWPDGTLKAQIDGANKRTDYLYDPLDRVKTVTDPLTRATNYRYDTASRLTQQWDHGTTCAGVPRGCTVYGYNHADELFSVNYGDPATPDVTSTTYDANGRPKTQTAGGATTAWVWDRLGRLKSRSQPVEGTVGYDYDGTSDLVNRIVYPGGVQVDRVYDDAGRMRTVDDWAATAATFNYDANSRIDDLVFPTGVDHRDDYGYDRAGRLTSVTMRKGSSVLGSVGYTHDDTGLVETATPVGLPGDSNATFTYTDLTQLKGVTGATAEFGYDQADNLTRLADGTTQGFDVANQLCWASPSGASGSCLAPPVDATVFGYDNAGNRTTATGPDGVASTFGYDEADRMVSASVPTPPSEAQGQYTPLTQARILDTRVNQGTCDPAPCNRMTPGETMRFDVLGLGGFPAANVEAVVVNVTLSNPGATGMVKVNQVAGSNASAALMNYQAGEAVNSMVIAVPDAAGYLKIWTDQAVDPVVDVVGYYAAPDGTDGTVFEPITPTRLVDTRVNQGLCPTNPCTKPAAGQSRQIKVAGQAGVPATGVQAVTINLSALNPAATGHFKVNASSVNGTGTATLQYQAGESTNMTTVAKLSASGTITVHTAAAADILIDVVGYHVPGSGPDDNVFNPIAPVRVAKTTLGEGVCDPAPCDRLAAGETVGFAVAGQQTVPAEGISAVAASVTVENPGATGFAKVAPVTTTGAAAATLHYQGAQTVNDVAIAQLDSNGYLPIYSQQAADVVVEITGWYIPGQVSTNTWTYTYNGEGLRTSKTSPTGVVTTYTWDHHNPWPLLIAETTNGQVTRWTYGPDARPIAQHNPNGTIHYMHHDQLGSTRLLTDQAGNTAATYTYAPFGQTTSHTGAATTPLGFAGEYTDAETGYQYLRARYYDPATAQFTSRDPMAPISRDPNGYANNSPHNYTDPTGNLPIIAAVLIGAAIGAGLDLAFQAGGNLANGCGAFDNIDWGSVALWGAVGGLTSGFASLAGGGKVLTKFGSRVRWADDIGAIGRPPVPRQITGYAINRDGSRHGLHQAIGRDGVGVSPRAILDAVRHGKATWQRARGTFYLLGDDAVVVLNPRGQVVTTWARGSRAWR